MTTTVVTCPRCRKATFSNAIMGAINVSAEHVDQTDVHYMVLTCQHCNNQLQFVVDLQPEFARV